MRRRMLLLLSRQLPPPKRKRTPHTPSRSRPLLCLRLLCLHKPGTRQHHPRPRRPMRVRHAGEPTLLLLLLDGLSARGEAEG